MEMKPITVSEEYVNTRRDLIMQGAHFEVHALLKALEKFPEDKLQYKPHEKSMPVDYLFWHCLTGGLHFLDGINAGEFSTDFGQGQEMPKSKDELIVAMKKIHEEVTEKFAATPVEKLTAQLGFFGGPPMAAIGYMDWYLQHLIHHRGQATVYLRLLNLPVPAIYGDSADEKWGAA